MGKKRLVADTNVLISGCGWRGKPYRIVLALESYSGVKIVTPSEFAKAEEV